MIEFAVHDAGPGAHALYIARANDAAVSHAVFVFHEAPKHVGNDFHIAVPMSTETGSGDDAIIVEHSQVSETQMVGIVVMTEGKSVGAV